MTTLEELSELIQVIYAAAERPALWQEFLGQACAKVSAPSATMIIIPDLRDPIGRVELSVGLEPAALKAYGAEWITKDPWVEGKKLGCGEVSPSQAICSDRDFERSECYNEFYRSINVFQGMGGVVDIEGNTQVGLYFHYPKTSPPCGKDRLDLLRLLLPHLRQAVRLYRRLQAREPTELAIGEFVDHLPVGFVVIGLDRRVVRTNREAERILREQDGLGQVHGTLQAWLSSDQQTLRYLIGSAVTTTDRGGVSHGGLTTVTRRSGKAAYQVVVTPISCEGALFQTQRAGALLLLTDPTRSPRTRNTAMRKLFGFTKAEARIAAALLEGQRTNEIAHHLQITNNTLRTHLKSLYAKAGARGQGDLIRLLLRSAATNWEAGTEFNPTA